MFLEQNFNVYVSTGNLFSEKQCFPAEGGFPKPIALCIPRLCPWFHSKYCTRGYQRRNKGGIFLFSSYSFHIRICNLYYNTQKQLWLCSLVSLFFQVSLTETRTGSFSKESSYSGERNKFIILPVCLHFQQNILNTSTSQRKTPQNTLFSRAAHSGCFRRKQPIEVF